MVLAGAIIALWIACLSALTGSTLPKLNIVMQHQTPNETVIRLHKGDRLAPVNFRERWNAIADIEKASNAAGSVKRIPNMIPEYAPARCVKIQMSSRHRRVVQEDTLFWRERRHNGFLRDIP